MILPEKYICWLDISDCSGELVYRDVFLHLFSLKELQYEVDFVDSKIERASLASKLLIDKFFRNEKNVVLKAETLTDDQTFKFDLPRVQQIVTLGHSNNNYIFTDPSDNYSLWIVISVNGAIFKQEGNLDIFMQEVNKK